MLEIVIYVATILGGIAALWFFYDRFFGRSKKIDEEDSTVLKQEFNRARSEDYKERGRERVQQWGATIGRGEWNWDYLGQAFEYYFDAIRYDPTHQHPWTNLAFVYHLVGELDKARTCLEESRQLASPGPNHPGRNYKQVELAVERGTTLSDHPLHRPEMPEQFRRKYRVFLDSLPSR